MRIALGDAPPLYRDASEVDAARASGSSFIRAFIAEALPPADAGRTVLVTDLIETPLTQVGSSVSETERTADAITTDADAMADMFCAYLSMSAQDGETRS